MPDLPGLDDVLFKDEGDFFFMWLNTERAVEWANSQVADRPEIKHLLGAKLIVNAGLVRRMYKRLRVAGLTYQEG